MPIHQTVTRGSASRAPVISLALTLAALLLVFMPACHGEGRRVHRTVSPSVVLVVHPLGMGSGIVLDSKGIVLTNWHVIQTPFPLQVMAKVKRGNRTTVETFDEVEVLGVHPRYDAALLKVNVRGGKLDAIGRSLGNPLEKGDEVFAVGNPAGLEGVFVDTITRGEVLAPSVQLDGLEYIYFSSPVNPGNSGGPLVDERGRLLGMVTFKLEGTDGTGLAIPFEALEDRKEFVPAENRLGNARRAAELLRLFESAWAESQTRAGEEQAQAIDAARACLLLVLAEAPDDASILEKIGLTYKVMGELDAAEAYFQRSLARDPERVSSHANLGYIASMRGNEDEASEHYWRALDCKANPANREERHDAAISAMNLQVHYVSRGDIARGFYMLRWSDSLYSDPEERASREQLSRAMLQNLHAEQQRALSGTRSYSREGMEAFVQLDPDYQLRPELVQTQQDRPRLIAVDAPPGHPGKPWSGALDLPEGSKLIVEHGPPGLALEPGTMTLEWDVPEDMERGIYAVLISITPPGEDEDYVEVRVTVN